MRALILLTVLFAFQPSSTYKNVWVKFRESCESSGESREYCSSRRSSVRKIISKGDRWFYFEKCFNDRCDETNFNRCVSACLDWAECNDDTFWILALFSSCDN